MRIFVQDAAVVAVGVSCLRVMAYGYGFYAFGMVVAQAFTGAGDTATPTRINLFCYWLFQIPVAWWLAHRTGLGVDGVFWAITLSATLLAITAILVFRRGTWKKQMI